MFLWIKSCCSVACPRRLLRPRAVAAVLLLVGLIGCSRSEDTEPKRPNVVLVTLDTLRADSLGSYGYRRDTSPFLDRLAAEGIRLTHAYSVSSWTVPAMASLFTGVLPATHGVSHGLVTQDGIVGQEVLAEDFQLLAETLQRAGYRTYGVAASAHLDRRFGFAQGFDRFENVGFSNAPKALRALAAMAGEIVEGEDPYFLWLHLFDPHDPYKPRQPWIRDYFPQPGELRQSGFSSPRELRNDLAGVGRAAGESFDRVVEFARAVYDSEINFTDRAVRRAFGILEVSPADLVLVTSDHGEEFLEHRDFGHAGTLFEEQVRVPMIVRLPNLAHAGKVIEAPVSLLDVLPSIVDWLGLDSPESVQGRSFLRWLEEGAAPERPIHLALSRPRSELSGVLVDNWKYIHDHGQADDHRLYNLARDPRESRNLIDEEPDRARQLAQALSSHLAAAESLRPEVTVEEIPPETLEQLRALGYVD